MPIFLEVEGSSLKCLGEEAEDNQALSFRFWKWHHGFANASPRPIAPPEKWNLTGTVSGSGARDFRPPKSHKHRLAGRHRHRGVEPWAQKWGFDINLSSCQAQAGYPSLPAATRCTPACPSDPCLLSAKGNMFCCFPNPEKSGRSN